MRGRKGQGGKVKLRVEFKTKSQEGTIRKKCNSLAVSQIRVGAAEKLFPRAFPSWENYNWGPWGIFVFCGVFRSVRFEPISSPS
jgi:hypothetical protein